MAVARRLVVGAALVLVGGLIGPVNQARAEVVVSYTDVAVTGAVATNVTGVNAGGAIAGYYLGGRKGTTEYGFTLSSPITTLTTIMIPGATSTTVNAINDSGTTVGSYVDRRGTQHAFIRTNTGTVTAFDDPALVTKGVHGYGTVATGINAAGVVVGYSFTVGPDRTDTREYVTHNHGFVRSSTGVVTTYDAPDAATSGLPSVGTRLLGISDAGDRVGAYTYNVGPELGPDTRNIGFELSVGGTFTQIVQPGVPLNACGWTEPHGINDAGVIVGNAGNGCAGTEGGWLLAGGTFTDLVFVSGAETSQYTLANSINDAGVIGGSWGNGIGVRHGYTATTS